MCFTLGWSLSVESTVSNGVLGSVPSFIGMEYTFSVNCGEWSLISVRWITTVVVSCLSGSAPRLIPVIVRVN